MGGRLDRAGQVPRLARQGDPNRGAQAGREGRREQHTRWVAVLCQGRLPLRVALTLSNRREGRASAERVKSSQVIVPRDRWPPRAKRSRHSPPFGDGQDVSSGRASWSDAPRPRNGRVLGFEGRDGTESGGRNKATATTPPRHVGVDARRANARRVKRPGPSEGRRVGQKIVSVEAGTTAREAIVLATSTMLMALPAVGVRHSLRSLRALEL